jgi:hypothetical protein
MMRETEQYLSVNWLEVLNRSDRAIQIRDLRSLYATKLRVGTAARIAALNVGALRAKVEREAPTAGYFAYRTSLKNLMTHPMRGSTKFPMTMKLSRN